MLFQIIFLYQEYCLFVHLTVFFLSFEPCAVTFLDLDFQTLLLFFHAALKFEYEFKFVPQTMLQTSLIFRKSTGPCKTSQIPTAKLKF